MDLVLPATDAGAITQMAAALLFILAVAILLRNHRNARTLMLGVGVFAFALMALRTVH